jgi:TctA family transporter
MMMYGLKPGPLIFQQNRFLINQIFSVALVSQLFLLVIGWAGIKAFTYFYKFPRNVVLVGIGVFCIVGSYALRNNLFDVGIMLFFGILGFIMERCQIPMVPLILALILGPMIEDNLRVGLVKTDGSFLPFLIRPICSAFFILFILLFFWEPISKAFELVLNKRKKKDLRL